MERNEAINVVIKNYPHVSFSGSEFETALRVLVPELAESEDERIRKELLAVINDLILPDEQKARFNAYLEKHKEQEPLSTEETELNSIAFLEQMGYTCIPPKKEHQNNSDAPKNALGGALNSPLDKDKNLDDIAQDYVEAVKEYNPEPTWNLMQTAVCYGYHYREEEEQKPNIELIQRSWYMEGYHDREFGREPKWVIKTGEGGPKYEKNEKYGQPLEQKPAERSEETMDEFTRNIRNLITDKLTVHTKGLDGSEISSTVFIDDKTAKDIASGILFYVGKEAMKNPDREIPEWSEEDDIIIDGIIANLEYLLCNTVLVQSTKENIEARLRWLKRLKSLRPQPKYEWSEEEENMMSDIIGVVESDSPWSVEEEAKHIDFLKSLRPSWKPSEEQMEALNGAWTNFDSTNAILETLYNDLKKLM